MSLCRKQFNKKSVVPFAALILKSEVWKLRVIIGAGIYGLYSALYLGSRSDDIVEVLEYDTAPFKRATYINQARVHMGYHYPRSLTTAMKSAGYFKRFLNDFDFCIHKSFKQVYSTSRDFSWTNAYEFERFCRNAGIKCERVDPNKYFRESMCDGAFLTEEYTYDAQILKDYLLDKIAAHKNIKINYSIRIDKIIKDNGIFTIMTNKGDFLTNFILNATYASTNQISKMIKESFFKIKYELCEIILCDINDELADVGLTVMDGPFFSIMPFGKTGLHSLTSVTFTPHMTSFDDLPKFECMETNSEYCSEIQLGNCNECERRPTSAWPFMSSLARKYIRDNFRFFYKKSLYSMKPILMESEVDDSRPTVIRMNSVNPTYISVLSGKINTVYDLAEVLDEVLGNE